MMGYDPFAREPLNTNKLISMRYYFPNSMIGRPIVEGSTYQIFKMDSLPYSGSIEKLTSKVNL